MLGTNDVKERFNATPANITKGLERLVRKAQDTTDAWRNQKSNILIIAPPPIQNGYQDTAVAGEMGEKCVEKSQALAPLYEEAAARLGCHFLDAATIEGIEMYPYDHMHLSLESHRLLAKHLACLIPKII
jgi:lysophospholipase L1-like esterase